MKKLVSLLTLFIAIVSIKGQVTVDNTSLTVEQYIQTVLVGTGVTVTNIQFNGGPANIINEQVGSFNDVNSATGLPNGLILGSGSVAMAAQLNTGGGSSLGGTGAQGVDTDLASITPNQIFDECVIEFDFVPVGDTIKFNYVFASEEYDEFVCGTVNDAFGFFLSGPNPSGGLYTAQNVALIPDPLNPGSFTSTPVSINTVNLGTATGAAAANCTAIDPNFAAYNVFYTQNTGSVYEYDGKTVVLQARADVICGATYHIKLAIGDGGDGAWDSGVFLEGGSFSSSQVLVTIPPTPSGDSSVIEGCSDATISFTRPNSDSVLTVTYGVAGTATNGTDYNLLPGTITFPIGVDTVDLVITPVADGIPEGSETLIISAFTLTPCGDTIVSSGTIFIRDIPNMFLSSNDTSLTCPSPSIPISVSASGAVPPFSYVWTNTSGNTIGSNSPTINVGGLQTDTFYVDVTDSCNLITLRDTIIVVSGVPPLTFSSLSNDTTIFCIGAPIVLNASAGGGIPPVYRYIWNTGDTIIGVAPTPASITVNPTVTTTYIVEVNDLCNSTVLIDSITITVSPPSTTVGLTNDIVFPCPGSESVEIIATVTDGIPPFTFNWGTTSSDTDSIINFTVNSSQTVTVTVTDQCQIPITATMNIIFTPYTPMSVTTNTLLDTICAGDLTSVTTNVVNGSPPYTYNWSTGETTSFINFSSNTVGNNNIVVNVNDQCQQANASADFEVIGCEVSIPTIFTPNGDGINDVLLFGSLSLFPNNKLTVFNRWGKKVFEKDSYQNDWDGDDYPDGTYFFVLELNGASDTVHKGSITLLK